MSLEAITIYRSWPVINGHVQVPNNEPADKTRVTLDEALTAVTNSTASRLTQGMGIHTGSSFGAQEFLVLPGVHPGEDYSADPVSQVSQV